MPGQPELEYTSPNVVNQFGRTGIDALSVRASQTDPSAPPPPDVIDPGFNWAVTLKFRIGGGTANLVQTSGWTGNVNFFYEGRGGAPDGKLNAAPVPIAASAGAWDATSKAYEYTVDHTVAAGLIADPGLYQLSASVTFGPAAGPPQFLAFVEGQMIQKY